MRHGAYNPLNLRHVVSPKHGITRLYHRVDTDRTSVTSIHPGIAKVSQCAEYPTIITSKWTRRFAYAGLGNLLQPVFRLNQFFVKIPIIQLSPATVAHTMIPDSHSDRNQCFELSL